MRDHRGRRSGSRSGERRLSRQRPRVGSRSRNRGADCARIARATAGAAADARTLRACSRADVDCGLTLVSGTHFQAACSTERAWDSGDRRPRCDGAFAAASDGRDEIDVWATVPADAGQRCGRQRRFCASRPRPTVFSITVPRARSGAPSAHGSRTAAASSGTRPLRASLANGNARMIRDLERCFLGGRATYSPNPCRTCAPPRLGSGADVGSACRTAPSAAGISHLLEHMALQGHADVAVRAALAEDDGCRRRRT